jgi:phosphoenolpyruvate synthase/pyruvate phosphate dikinase
MNVSLPKPIFEKLLSKIKWIKIYSREYGVQYSEMAILCLSSKAKYHIPSPSSCQVILPEENNTAFYIDSDSWNKLVASLNNNYTNNIGKLQNYEKQFFKDGKNYFIYAKKLSEMNFKGISNKNISLFYKKYQDKLFRYSVFAWTSFILNNYVSDRATTIVKKYIQKKSNNYSQQDILASLFHPEKKAAVLKLQNDIALLQTKKLNLSFDRLFKKYRWMSCLDIHNKPWSKEEFKKHILDIKPTLSRKPTSFSEYKKKLQFSNSDYKYLTIARHFVFIKDARDDFRRQGVYLAGKFFREIANRLHITVEDLSYLQESEVVNWLENNLPIDHITINERKDGFILYLNKNNQLTCLSGKHIPIYLKQLKLSTNENEKKELKGIVASKGSVKGKVIIVKGVKDLVKVQNGQILVAVSTHPDYVSAMRKAAAIITDEGGITSHAAIVAREFGIPCMVGTINATKLLKDGNMIELDGNKGIIRILK